VGSCLYTARPDVVDRGWLHADGDGDVRLRRLRPAETRPVRAEWQRGRRANLGLQPGGQRGLQPHEHVHAQRRFGYDFDKRWRRENKQRSGAAYAASFYEGFGYNDRSELTATSYFAGTPGSSTAVAANDHGYNYDPIGNRRTSSEVRDWDDDPGFFAEPSPNALNQYPARRTTDTGAGACDRIPGSGVFFGVGRRE
jgi:hypothetical protein